MYDSGQWTVVGLSVDDKIISKYSKEMSIFRDSALSSCRGNVSEQAPLKSYFYIYQGCLIGLNKRIHLLNYRFDLVKQISIRVYNM